ncbi:MAG: gluconate 2-dehydrogenase subunit 3 family protein [Balneolaceae bacterium]|nr:gluconate 2-dehydrogenase subunit 3 family protein [Balneolaceae bacterium]
MEKIDRKEAIRRTALIMGGTLSSPLIAAVLSGCEAQRTNDWNPEILSEQQLQTTADLAEVILPSTSTPGAKDAKVELFIDSMIAEWMSPEQKEITITGLNHLISREFSGLLFEEQTQFIQDILDDEDGRNFFRLFKRMAMLGFYTSETGATQVLQYDEIPGDYYGCEDLEDLGGRTWAT